MNITHKRFLSMPIAVAMWFIASVGMPVQAQTPAQKVGLATVGTTTLLETFDMSTGGEAGDAITADATTGRFAVGAGRDFEVDMIFESDIATAGFGPILYYDSSKIQLVGASDVVAGAALGNPAAADASGAGGGGFWFFQTPDGTTDGDSDATTDRSYGPLWATSATLFGGATGPMSVMTLKIRWLDGAKGSTTINWGKNTLHSGDLTGTRVTFNGPPFATAEKNAVICMSAAAITDFAECDAKAQEGVSLNVNDSDPTLMMSAVLQAAAPAGEAVTFTLTATDGSNAIEAADATGLPATGDTIVVAAGATAGAKEYTIDLDPDTTGDGGLLRIGYALSTADATRTTAIGGYDPSTLQGTNIEVTTSGLKTTAGAAQSTADKSAVVTHGAGTMDTFYVSLLSTPSADVTVAIAAVTATGGSTASAEVTVEPSELTFTAANADQGQLVTVTGIDGATSNTDYFITLKPTSTDANYGTAQNAEVTGASKLSSTGTISMVSVPELPAGAKAFTLSATIGGGLAPLAECTVTLAEDAAATAAADNSADSTNDYSAIDFGTLAIAIGSQTGDSSGAMITTVADNDAEIETIGVSGTASCDGVSIAFSGGEINIVDAGISVVAADADDDGILEVGEGGDDASQLDADGKLTTGTQKTEVKTSGGGTQDWFYVTLLSNPNGAVTVGVSSTETAEATVSPASLNFTAENWDVAQLVTVSGAGGATLGSTYTINLDSESTANENYAGATPDKEVDGQTVLSAKGVFTAADITEAPAGESKPFPITATIGGTVVLDAACEVTPSVDAATTDAVENATTGDYTGLTLAAITIPVGSRSASSNAHMITTVDDGDNDQETIGLTASVTCGTVVASDITFTGTVKIIDKTAGDVAASLHTEIATVVAQHSIAHGLANVETRASSPRVNAVSFRLNGSDTTQAALLDHMKTMANAEDATEVEYDWKLALSNSSLVMPLSGDGGAAFWVNGDYRSFDGDSDVNTWDGNATNIAIGADVCINPNMLVGAMVAVTDGSFDYQNTSVGTPSTGKYELSSTAIRPYFAWSAGDVSIWGSVGFGSGEAETQDSLGGTVTQDTSETSLAVGLRQQVAEGMAIKADVSFATLEMDAKGDANAQEIDSRRTRLMLEGRTSHSVATGSLSPSVEIGIRHDLVDSVVTDGESKENSSSGAEAAAGVDYVHRALGITVSGKMRFYSGTDYDEWGISGTVSKALSASGLGLGFSLTPTHGDAESQVQSIYSKSFEDTMATADDATADADYSTRFNSTLSYGFRAPGARGVVTPYTEAVFGGSASERHRLGLRWKPHNQFNVDMHGENRATESELGMLFNWDRRLVDLSLAGKRVEGTNVDNRVELKGTFDF